MKNFLISSTAKRQRGVGLVELMIAIAIGLVLVTLVTSYYLSSRQSYQTTVVSSELTDAQRYAMQQIKQRLWRAGYPTGWCALAPDVPNDPEVPEFQSGQALAMDSEGDLWIRYAEAVLDSYKGSIDAARNQCEEETSAREAIYEKIYVGDNKVLRRQQSGKNSVPLLNGVEAVAFSLLIDGQESFVAAGTLTADDWRDVRAVRIDILVSSESRIYDAAVKQSYQWPGEAKNFEDRYMRAKVSEVLTLRNRNVNG